MAAFQVRVIVLAAMSPFECFFFLLTTCCFFKTTQNPKIQAALPSLMQGDQSKIMELMSDPEVGPVIQKLMGKLGGAMPGMGGGGGGGFPGPGAGGGSAPNDDDSVGDMPDLEEMD